MLPIAAVLCLFAGAGSNACGYGERAAPRAQPQASNDPVEAWIKRTAVPLATTDPDGPSRDLAALDSFIESRSVIAMGEATHGTKEFFQFKHRIFRYLVEKHGFTWFTIEMPHASAALIDAWIGGGEGQPEVLLQGSYWWVDSREIFDLIRWMRRHNEGLDEARRVHFFGFDVQKPEASKQALTTFLTKVDANLDVTTLLRDPDRLQSLLKENADRYKATAGVRAYDAAVDDAAVLAENAQTQRSCNGRQGCITVMRDGFMAENITRVVERSHGNVFVWAHNGHVAHVRHRDGWSSMGWWLRESLGARMAAVGFEFERGAFVAPAGGYGQTPRSKRLTHLGDRIVAEYVTGAPPSDSLAYSLSRVESPLFFLPLREAAKVAEVSAFFTKTRKLHEYGAMVPSLPAHFVDDDAISEAFDAIIFVRETHGYGFNAE